MALSVSKNLARYRSKKIIYKLSNMFIIIDKLSK